MSLFAFGQSNVVSDSRTTQMVDQSSEFSAASNASSAPLWRNPTSPLGRVMRKGFWALFFLFFLILFSVFKLPSGPIRSAVEGNINSLLANQGMKLTAKSSGLEWTWSPVGISYVFQDAALELPAPQIPVRFDRLVLNPKLLPFLIGRVGVNLLLIQGERAISGNISGKGDSWAANLEFKKVRLGKLGVLAALGVQGDVEADGTFDFSGEVSVPSSWDGALHLKLNQLSIEPQTIAGFSIPRLGVAEGQIDLIAEGAKLKIGTFKLGKSAQDDIQATLTGEVALGKTRDSSNMNLKSRFTLSPNVLRAFVLLEALLGAGKQTDGSFAYQLAGSMAAPLATPGL